MIFWEKERRLVMMHVLERSGAGNSDVYGE